MQYRLITSFLGKAEAVRAQILRSCCLRNFHGNCMGISPFHLVSCLIRSCKLLKISLGARFPLWGFVHHQNYHPWKMTVETFINLEQICSFKTYLTVAMSPASTAAESIWSLNCQRNLRLVEPALPCIPLCVGVRRGWDHSVLSRAPTKTPDLRGLNWHLWV